MENPFVQFLARAKPLLQLAQFDDRPQTRFAEYMANRKRQDFLQEILGRVAVVGYCHRALCDLADGWRAIETERAALPRDPENPNRTSIPEYLVEREEEWLTRVDAHTSLVYYEVVSLLGLLRQLDIVPTEASELSYLKKVRDRFLAHQHLGGVLRGTARDWRAREGGFLEYDVVALNSWDQDQLKALGALALPIGSQPWQEQRIANESLLLSGKHSEKFSPDEWARLMAAGVRDCKLEEALRDLAVLLDASLLPVIESVAQEAVREFGWDWWT